MTADFVATGTVLDKILAHKAEELAALKRKQPLEALREAAETAPTPRDFVAALQRETVALIAEVKHASPSRGVLIEDFDPQQLATGYAANGAAAISVLTDEQFFQGGLDDLRTVRAAVELPILRKDFTLDPYQLYEARAAGADAVLLIVAALADDQLSELHALAGELGLAALVEVHNATELERALTLNPMLVGINNRDLKTFDVDLATTAGLIGSLPAGVTTVAESGILAVADVQQMGALGADAVLVGEALVRAGDVAATVRAFSSQPRAARGNAS
jgi:indole-3-glycerol phosphate synthase